MNRLLALLANLTTEFGTSRAVITSSPSTFANLVTVEIEAKGTRDSSYRPLLLLFDTEPPTLHRHPRADQGDFMRATTVASRLSLAVRTR